MSEKRFIETERHCYYTSLVFDNQTQEELGTPKVVVLLNMFEDDVQIKDKKIEEQQATIQELERKLKKYAKIGEEQLKQIIDLQDICRQSDGKMKQPTTINLTEEDEKELRKLLGLIDDE